MSTMNNNKGDPLNEERCVIDNLIARSQNVMGSNENPVPQQCQPLQQPQPSPVNDCHVTPTKSQMMLKSRRGRTSFTPSQLSELEQAFATTHYPDFQTRKDLSKTLKIPDDRIQVWFQNRRAKWRKAQRQINGAGGLSPFQVSVAAQNQQQAPLPPVTEIALNFTMASRPSSIRHTASVVKTDPDNHYQGNINSTTEGIPTVSQLGSNGDTTKPHTYHQTEQQQAPLQQPSHVSGNGYLHIYEKPAPRTTTITTTSVPDNQRTAPSLYSLSATVTSSGQYIILGSNPSEAPTIIHHPTIPTTHHFQ